MPEKTINDLPRDLRMLYARGVEAMQRDNFDYAIEMFTQVLAKEPAIFEIRKTLRVAQNGKSGAKKGLFNRAFSSASSSPLIAKGQLALRKSPQEAIQIAEQVLNTDANNPAAHKLLAEAALAAEMPREAVMSLEVLVKNAPKDKELTFQLAEALADSGRKGEGEEVLVQLQRHYPADSSITSKLKDLSARKTLDEGGYGALAGGQGSYRDVLRNKAESVALEQEKRQVKSEDVNDSLAKDWEARLRAEPNNVKMLRNLGDLYTSRKDYEKALSYFDRIVATDGGADPNTMKTIADLKGRKFDQLLAQLDQTAPDIAERTAQIKVDKQEFLLSEAKGLADRYPTDLQLRFDLAKLYFESGKITEASQEFQKSINNPNRRIQSNIYLAKCFEKRNMNDMAARRLQDVLKEKLVFDEEKKDLIYTLGVVLEKMGKKEEAMDQFKQIYEVDMGYRDIGKRVEDYYASGGA